MNIYFSGIGGVGIGPLAEIAHDAGYTVHGSDAQDSLITKELRARGITVSLLQDGSFLQACHTMQPIDWFVHTAALPYDHPELVLARSLGIRTAKRDELLAHIIAEKNLKLIAIAGTHGKTTTTGMMVWELQQLGIPVSYSVGTTLSFGPSGKFDPASEYFVYECDEFDRNFLHFSPYLSLITSVDYDHPDTYPTEHDYMAAFRQFIDQSNTSIMWKIDGDKLAATSADGWILADNEVADIHLAGAHNRRNATLVLKAVEYLRLEDGRWKMEDGERKGDHHSDSQTDNPQQALEAFPGTDRRFEHLAEHLYSDYGHHPVEIAATLQLARELSNHVVLVYQPHQNVRQHEIKDQYIDQFELADDIYWLPTYLSREDPNLPILTPEELTKNITNKAAVHITAFDDELWNTIQQARSEGKLVLGMGAGAIDSWLREQNDIKQVANVLVRDTSGNFIMQQRDNKPGINSPGMITGFGGAVESGESVREAAVRELHEETNLIFDDDRLVYFKTLFQAHINDGTSRWVTYYVLDNQDISNLEVYEGAGYAVIDPQSNLDDVKLSDMARKALEAFAQPSDDAPYTNVQS
jgi:UDP-N-acetylmuramate--alanine ligase